MGTGRVKSGRLAGRLPVVTNKAYHIDNTDLAIFWGDSLGHFGHRVVGDGLGRLARRGGGPDSGFSRLVGAIVREQGAELLTGIGDGGGVSC